MLYNIRKNWVETFSLMLKRPIIILPFFIIAFLEGLALEIVYYFPRPPLLNITGPLIRKYFGEAFLHYPGNLVILPSFFHYAQILIYILFGVLLSAVSVHIFKNIRAGFTLQRRTIIISALMRCIEYSAFGVIMIGLMLLLRRADEQIFFKAMDIVGKGLPQGLLKLVPYIYTLFLFFSNIVLQTFLVLTIPLMVIKRRFLFTALLKSIVLGCRNFFSVFALIFLPFLIYLPVALLKTDSPKLIDKTFPEINLLLVVFGVILAVFVECFVILSASQFLLDSEKTF